LTFSKVKRRCFLFFYFYIFRVVVDTVIVGVSLVIPRRAARMVATTIVVGSAVVPIIVAIMRFFLRETKLLVTKIVTGHAHRQQSRTSAGHAGACGLLGPP
jgi:hypothetical protein